MTEVTITPIVFDPMDMYEAYEMELEDFEEVHLHLLEAIGGTANDWITVFQFSGDGTTAEIIIGLSGQSEHFKVTCTMDIPIVSCCVARGWQSWVFAFLCREFISGAFVTEYSMERINRGRLLLGLEPWTLRSAYADLSFTRFSHYRYERAIESAL
jgi:hypothetical protein